MNSPFRTPLQFDLQGLIQAVSANHSTEGLTLNLTTVQWDVMAAYLHPIQVAQGQVLIEQGALDRTLYLVESGSLTVHFEDDKGRVRLAIVGAGSAVGEGAFFTRQPRNATVQAAGPCKVWSLAPIRFAELSNRQPAVALELAMALGSLVSRRLMNKPRRVAVT